MEWIELYVYGAFAISWVAAIAAVVYSSKKGYENRDRNEQVGNRED